MVRHSVYLESQTFGAESPFSSCLWWTSTQAVVGIEKCLNWLACSYLGYFKNGKRENELRWGRLLSPPQQRWPLLESSIPTPLSTRPRIPGPSSPSVEGRPTELIKHCLTQHWPFVATASLLRSARAFEEHDAVWLSVLAASGCHNYSKVLKNSLGNV